ncbi:MAG: hydrolase [Acidobacteria bacterium]|nr:hydrolase [Acidobacteriota bacterium]
MRRRFLLAALLLALAATGLSAQPLQVAGAERSVTAERMADAETIALDGVLDEAAWQRAVPATDFIQQDPLLGGTPTERTEVRFIFNQNSLYMGVLCFDSEPDQLLGNTMKRDEFLSADDRFMWVMDTFLDRQSGYFFEMNPSGLMADSLMGAGGGQSREWDGIWDAKVLRSDLGWTLEIEIPFRTLNFDPNGLAWGVNFQRTIRRKNEENLWTGQERNQGLRRMANAGLLYIDIQGEGVTQGLGLDVKPYLAGSGEESPGRDPATPLTGSADAGVDLFYNLTPGLRANLTINTDFAQTEVDQRLVNLTRFPLFFPEKRDFFLDGATFFDFYVPRNRQNPNIAVQPFFSRRIGLDESGQPQKIDYGTKLTGQYGQQDIGFLHVRTGEEDDVIGEDFTVLRLKRRVLTQSYLGMFYSRRAERDATSITEQTAGADFRLATSTFRGSNNLEVNGFLLWNTDPTDSDPGDNLAYGVRLDYPNDRWEAGMSFTEVQEDHDPAVGFTRRTAFRAYQPRLRFAPRPAQHDWLRQVAVGVNADLRTDMANQSLTRRIDVTLLRLELHSQDNVELSLVPTYESLEDDFEISDGIILPAGSEYDFTRFRISGNTANRRVLSARTRFEVGSFFSGTREEIAVSLGIRPRPGVTLRLEHEWNDISLAEGGFQTRLYRMVADTQFSPWIYLVNNVQFDSVSEVLGWQSRLRWILTPGNDLFVVYTQNWLDDEFLDRFATLDRRSAAKFVFTHRF